MQYGIESTKTNAGTRQLPMTEDVYQYFPPHGRVIIRTS